MHNSLRRKTPNIQAAVSLPFLFKTMVNSCELNFKGYPVISVTDAQAYDLFNGSHYYLVVMVL